MLKKQDYIADTIEKHIDFLKDADNFTLLIFAAAILKYNYSTYSRFKSLLLQEKISFDFQCLIVEDQVEIERGKFAGKIRLKKMLNTDFLRKYAKQINRMRLIQFPYVDYSNENIIELVHSNTAPHG